MTTIDLTVLRTIRFGLYPLRIYASPLNVPDHPWALFEDLAALAEVGDIEQARWLAKIRQDTPDMVHELPDRSVIIAEPLVGGLFQAWVTIGVERAQKLLDDWTEAWTDLFVAQNRHLAREEWLQVVREAELQNVLKVPGATVMQ